MEDEEVERSESGNPIYRYQERKKPFELAYTSSEDVELLEKHIGQHVGNADTVWHELISDLVHLDVHHIKPTVQRNVHTLVTTWMSDLAMNPPTGAEAFKYAELLITLPPEWPLTDDAFEDEANYWVMRLLKSLARFPHAFETWLWWGHTVPNGNPAEPYHNSTNFVGAILAPPITVAKDFLTLKCSPEKQVHFFSVIPLYQAEMDLKLKKGMDPLFDLFDKHGISEVVDVNRKNVAGKKWWPFG